MSTCSLCPFLPWLTRFFRSLCLFHRLALDLDDSPKFICFTKSCSTLDLKSELVASFLDRVNSTTACLYSLLKLFPHACVCFAHSVSRIHSADAVFQVTFIPSFVTSATTFSSRFIAESTLTLLPSSAWKARPVVALFARFSFVKARLLESFISGRHRKDLIHRFCSPTGRGPALQIPTEK